MQADKNPFAPDAGAMPPELAGRDAILQDADDSCGRALAGMPPRSFMIIGPRGTGKTVLLRKIAQQAEEAGLFIASMAEARKDIPFAQLLFPLMNDALLRISENASEKDSIDRGFKGLRNFARAHKIADGSFELSDGIEQECFIPASGILEIDLQDVFELIGKAARKAVRVWVLLIDEIQRLPRKELSALIAAMHWVSQNGLPVILIGAGLPQTARLAGEAKSYSERLFDWRRMRALERDAIEKAVRIPLEQCGMSISPEAAAKIAEISQGHPFFIQALAYCAWQEAKPPMVTLEDVRKACRPAVELMMESIFNVRLDRLTDTEMAYLKVMARGNSEPCRVSDIAWYMKWTPRFASRVRSSLIRKGVIFGPRRGWVDFTVPLFAQYLNGTLLKDKS